MFPEIGRLNSVARLAKTSSEEYSALEVRFNKIILDGYKLETVHSYCEIDGAPIYWKVRFNNGNKKEIRSVSFIDGKWQPKEPCFKNKKPLYRRDLIAKNPDQAVWLVEGEKCADSLVKLGFIATTSGGSTSVEKTDFNILHNRHVCIWPDNDDPGIKYCEDLISELITLSCHVDVVDTAPLNLPESGDCVDFLEASPGIAKLDLEKLGLISGEDYLYNAWPEPEVIETKLKPVTPFSSGLIPEPFKGWIDDVSFRMQAPPDFLFVSVVTMISSLIGTGCAIKPKANDDWVVVPNLWGAIVGRPSIMKKSPSITEAISPLSALEKEAAQDYEKNIKNHEFDSSYFEAQQKAWKTKLQQHLSPTKEKPTKENTATPLDSLKNEYRKIVEPEKLTLKRYRVNDATIEKLGELLVENPRGLLLVCDELTGLIASWDKNGHECDRAFYLQAWNGYGSHIVDRISRGTINVENLCVSILGGIQPDKLMEYLFQSMHNLNNDGLLQRFQMMVYPDEPQQLNASKSTDKKPNDDIREKVKEIVKKIADQDFSKLGLPVAKGLPCFVFDKDAQDYFYELMDEVDSKIRSEPVSIIAEHVGKYKSLIPSVALVFHLINFFSDETKQLLISEDSLMLAKCVCDYLESHARRIYGLIEDVSIAAAKELANKIRERKFPDNCISLRDLKRKNWRLLNKDELAKKACEELVDSSWLKESFTPPAFGQKPKVTYKINPKVRGLKF